MSDAPRYGHFDDSAREYVITRPDTPWPWINYLGTGDFFSIISNAAGGYSFYRDARLRRITRYRYNDVPPDQDGRLFYIRDGESVWNPGGRPSPAPLDRYECRHGVGYTRLRASRAEVEADLLFFVPVGSDCEIQQVTLRNLGRTAKRITLFSFTEFCLWNALDDMTNFQRNLNTGEVRVEDGMVCHLTEYRERRNHFSFYGVNVPPAAVETRREAFTGRYGGYALPEAVRRGSLEQRGEGAWSEGWWPAAVFQHEIALAPGASQDLVFVLGYVENPADGKWRAPGVPDTSRALEMRARFDSKEKVTAAFGGLQAHWEDLLGRFTLQSGEARLDRMVNTWNQYQCMVTFLMARSASLFESGIGRGIGFRDTSQDLLGCMHQVPERARQRLFDVASTQRPDGGAWHQYQPLTRRGNADVGDGFNDDPLWLIFGVSAYLKETGDWQFLQEPVPFDNDPRDAAPLFEHLRRSFDHVVNHRGPHGLPLIGHADWNDCLNLNCFSSDPN
ncbi:MAG TPA: glycosyl transferase, partial [Spirochaetia bacterium]|nr:glycosyl transferase [Spirochaetia bacterium]